MNHRHLGLLFVSVLAIASSFGCAKPSLDSVPTTECASGKKWNDGDEGSSLMHPGRDCIGCHSLGEGPSYVVAGTVYAVPGQADDCAGVSGATVTIVDSKGATVSLSTNEAGNFSLRNGSGLVPPFTASVSYGGKSVTMVATQQTGACGSCHDSSQRLVIP